MTTVLALIGGLALPFSFAPTLIWPLALLSVGGLYFLIQSASPKQGFWIGWVFGLGYFGIGVHWVYYSLHLFGAAIAPLAVLLTFVFVLVMTVFPAVSASLWCRYKLARSPYLNVLLFASLWVLSEILRGKILDGFPWILLGYSQTSGPLGHLAPFMGVYGISFFIVLVAGLLVVLMQQTGRSRVATLMVLLVGGGVALSLKSINFSEPLGSPVTVRMVQANIPQEMKFSRERLQNALNQYVGMSTGKSLQDVDLIIWPETAIPTYFDRVDAALEPFINSMDAQGVDILSGGFQRDGDNIYNAVRQLGGDRAVYRKRHLVPFGEYMPLRFILDFAARYIDIPMSDLAAGSGPHVPLQMQGTSIGVSICYEDVYGEEMRALLPASGLLVNVSNDAWFGDSSAPHQHEQKAQMRAREFARPLVRVTNTGVSSAIDHNGNILGRIKHNEAGTLDISVQPRSGQTLYASTGNWPVIVVALMLLVFVVFKSKVFVVIKPK
ncbi:MAG: apolipoprotein N-acyltransferase [Granulosicoccus sp.]